MWFKNALKCLKRDLEVSLMYNTFAEVVSINGQ